MVKDYEEVVKYVEEIKQQEIAKYDLQIAQLKKEKSIAKFYYNVILTLSNLLNKKEILTKILKDNLTGKILGNCEVDQEINYIVFYDDHVEVKFPKYRTKSLEINYKNIPVKPCKYTYVTDSSKKLKELTEDYLNNKTFKTLRVLADYNGNRYKKNPIATILKYKNTYRNCNKELVDKINKQIEEDLERERVYLEKMKEYTKEKQKTDLLVAQIKKELEVELKDFKDDNWVITEKMNRHPQHAT